MFWWRWWWWWWWTKSRRAIVESGAGVYWFLFAVSFQRFLADRHQTLPRVQNSGAISDNFATWSQISPDRNKISSIRKRHYKLQYVHPCRRVPNLANFSQQTEKMALDDWSKFWSSQYNFFRSLIIGVLRGSAPKSLTSGRGWSILAKAYPLYIDRLITLYLVSLASTVDCCIWIMPEQQ